MIRGSRKPNWFQLGTPDSGEHTEYGMKVSPSITVRSMASSPFIAGIAVVGKSNEPLYLCDCERLWLSLQNDASISQESSDAKMTDDQRKDGENDNQDPFGFIKHNSQNFEQRTSMSLFCQILIHAALDNLEEKIERPSGRNGQMPVIIRSNTASSIKNDPLHWLGVLLDSSTSDGYAVYGYITATNIKLMAITKDLMVPTNPAITKAIQTLLQEVHQHYITYLLNPFCDTRGGSIQSKQFDARIATSIHKVQQLTESNVPQH